MEITVSPGIYKIGAFNFKPWLLYGKKLAQILKIS